MGNFGSTYNSRMKGTTKLGAATECPMCGEPFDKKQTYDAVRQSQVML